MGRPSKFDKDRAERFLAAIRGGNHVETAAALAGVHRATVYRWLEQGEGAKGGPFRDFCDAYTQAQALAEAKLVQRWQAATERSVAQETTITHPDGTVEVEKRYHPPDWRAARDFLARRHPERWSGTSKVEVSGPEGGPVQLHQLTDEELARIAAGG